MKRSQSPSHMQRKTKSRRSLHWGRWPRCLVRAWFGCIVRTRLEFQIRFIYLELRLDAWGCFSKTEAKFRSPGHPAAGLTARHRENENKKSLVQIYRASPSKNTPRPKLYPFPEAEKHRINTIYRLPCCQVNAWFANVIERSPSTMQRVLRRNPMLRF